MNVFGFCTLWGMVHALADAYGMQVQQPEFLKSIFQSEGSIIDERSTASNRNHGARSTDTRKLCCVCFAPRLKLASHFVTQSMRKLCL